MSKHTPGPWKVDPASGYSSGHEGDGDVRVRVGLGQAIASFHDQDILGDKTKSNEEKWANAYLGSAAPELLTALKRIVVQQAVEKHLKDFDIPAYVSALNAIAKAEGDKS